MTQKKSTQKRSSKKGGTFELAPLVATGALYGTALYNKKKGRKMRGGEGDVVVSSPGGAVPVINAGKPEMPTKVEPAVGGKAVPSMELASPGFRHESPAAAVTGSAAHSPLVANMLDLSKNQYLGATAGSRPASVDAPGSLLEGGGKKKRRTRKYKGGESCQAMAAPIPTNAGAGGDIRASPVVSGAVGGVAAQEMNAAAQDGGAKKRRKAKKRGGAEGGEGEEGGAEGGDYNEGGMDGGAKKRRKAKKRGGNPDMAEGGEGVDIEGGDMEGGAKKRRKGKKHGGSSCGITAPAVPMEGGAKKRKSKKRGGAEEGGAEEGGAEEGGSYVTTAEAAVEAMQGGAKKRKSKKRGGAYDVPEAFDAGADKAAPALGGFDNLLADLKQQVGGKYKKKRGGAFKLYAKELESLSKKLKKLM